MTMPESYRCWVCGRNSDEVNAVFHVEPPEDAELVKQASQIGWFKEKFLESAGIWRKSLPKDFRDMDFVFVVSNPDQFKAVKIVAEVNDARKLMMDWLVKASGILRRGEQGQIQNLNPASLTAAERDSLVKAIEQFEGRWRRQLAKEEGEGAASKDPAGFQGMSLAEGLEFLIAGGILYYEVQAMLIQFARNSLISKMPRWSVQIVEGRWGVHIPMCDVCAGLFQGIRVGRTAPGSEPERPQQVPPKPSHRPEPEAVQVAAPVPAPVAVPAPAPKHDRAAELAAEIPAGASPEYVELVKKLGPAAGDGSEKPKYLHDHRIKEEWDELVEKQSKQS
jgi:hypothetical protein